MERLNSGGFGVLLVLVNAGGVCAWCARPCGGGVPVKAWHWVADTLRDGTPIPKDGAMLKFAGKPILCERGFHASLRPWDALRFAPGETLCLVECGGTVLHQPDKLVCTERTILASMDAEPLLREFARMQALSVIRLWEPPEVVCDYLMTGDESLRDAARDAAWDAAGGAAWDAARAAARVAAGDAARDAARAAAWDAAGGAARAAARAAAGDAAGGAARAAARAAAGDAERDAAALAAWVAAGKQFDQMVFDSFEDWI
jgi:hypothetical protein